MKKLEDILFYSQPLKLLYVEDDEPTREVNSLFFDELFDEYVCASNGEEALSLFKQNRFDLVITDIKMPKMDGLELCREIRKIDEEIALIITTAHNDECYLLEGIKLGVEGYLIKPIDMEQLFGLIKRVGKKIYYKKQLEAYQNLLRQYKEVIDASSIVSKADPSGRITYVNDMFCQITKFSKDEILGKCHSILRHPDNPRELYTEIWRTIKKQKKLWKGLIRNIDRNGKTYYLNTVIKPILDTQGKIEEFIAVRQDVTDLINPKKLLLQALKEQKDKCLILMQLEHYDILEEFYDTETLEKLLIKTHDYLLDKLQTLYSDIERLYMLENGIYAVLIDKDKVDTIRFSKLQRLQQTIKKESISIDETLECDIGINISVVCEGENFLESAIIGLKRASKLKQSFIIANHFSQLQKERARQNIQKISLIKQALEHSRIVSYFQPIVDNKTGKKIKLESLVRLIDSDGKILTPQHFLEASKKSNLYTYITKEVLRRSFEVLEDCDLDISINLSVPDIERANTKELIFDFLERYKNYAHRITFELLEDEQFQNFFDISEFVTKVKSYGVTIAIDDFGSGYSNYYRLLEYRPDILKIDGSLIRRIDKDDYSKSVVKSIVTFAKERGIKTVAEFIENEEIFEIVKELGVDYSQGYFFGKPSPITQC